MGFPKMIVRCTYDKGVALTAREEYDVEYCTPTYCFVRNDKGVVQGFSFDRFSVIQHGVTRASDPEWEASSDNVCKKCNGTRCVYDGPVGDPPSECGECFDQEPNAQPPQKAIDSHYDLSYTLTQDDIDNGSIKLDPYFVANVWRTGSRDNSGVIFHILKTCARFGEKNEKAREIRAIYKSIKRLAELENVNLE